MSPGERGRGQYSRSVAGHSEDSPNDGTRDNTGSMANDAVHLCTGEGEGILKSSRCFGPSSPYYVESDAALNQYSI